MTDKLPFSRLFRYAVRAASDSTCDVNIGRTVCSPGCDGRVELPFIGIQAAVADAVDGDKLLLSPGTHSGPLLLSRKVCQYTIGRSALSHPFNRLPSLSSLPVVSLLQVALHGCIAECVEEGQQRSYVASAIQVTGSSV